MGDWVDRDEKSPSPTCAPAGKGHDNSRGLISESASGYVMVSIILYDLDKREFSCLIQCVQVIEDAIFENLVAEADTDIIYE